MARRPALSTIGLGALAAAGVVGAVAVVGSPAASTAQERTVTVARGVVQSTVSGSGNLAPANQVDVDFATSGEITHIYVKAGQHVARDELLAKIDPSAANVELAQAKASLQSAQDALTQAQESAAAASSATNASGASGSGSGSGSGAATSTTTVAGAQANVESAQLSVTSAEQTLAATTLRAPMAGTIAALNGSVGTTVGGGGSSSSSSSSSDSGSATVTGGLGGDSSGSSSSGSSTSSSFITLAQVSRYKMQVSLSESDIGSVKVGQPATVTVNAASGEQFAARVTAIGVLSSSSGSGSASSAVSYPVTLTLDQTGNGLKAGMSATADIVTSQVSGIAVPSQALSGSTVTVEAADGTQSTRQVQTGVVGNATTQVVSGLKAGDKVVVRSAAAALGAAAGGSDQLNSAIRSRLGGGGLGGAALGGGGFGGGGFGGGGGVRAPGGSGGRTP